MCWIVLSFLTCRGRIGRLVKTINITLLYVYRAHNHWAWIPPIACSLGGIAGAYLYIFTLEIHREPETLDKHVDRNNEQIAMEDSQVNMKSVCF